MDIINLLNIHQVRWDYQLSNTSAIRTFVTLDFLKLLKFGWGKFGEFMVVHQIRQHFSPPKFPSIQYHGIKQHDDRIMENVPHDIIESPIMAIYHDTSMDYIMIQCW